VRIGSAWLELTELRESGGDVRPAPVTHLRQTPAIPGGVPSDYALLKRRVREAGLLEKQPWFSAWSILVRLVLLAACIAVFALVHDIRVQALDALALGLLSGQLGFQMHDAGHRQMFDRAWLNILVGLLTANLLLGMSYGWWVGKHNRHHANPNHVDLDPDIDTPAIAYTKAQALRRRGVLRVVAKRQALLFFPMLSFLGWAMHAAGLTFLASQRSKFRWLEVAMLILHVALYVGLLVAFLGPWPAVLVIVIHKACGGLYLGSVFAPNHKGMLEVDGDCDLDFLRRQVLTARDVHPNPLIDVWYGGLNYQVEHHLFPTMARNRLRAAHAIVRTFCEDRRIPFHQTSILQSYQELLGFLHDVGAPLRKPPSELARVETGADEAHPSA
jgi:fatty acid desaturase